jgi:hypothetical protein
METGGPESGWRLGSLAAAPEVETPGAELQTPNVRVNKVVEANYECFIRLGVQDSVFSFASGKLALFPLIILKIS